MELPEIAICNSARLNTTKMELDGFQPEIIQALLNRFQSYHSFKGFLKGNFGNQMQGKKMEEILKSANISSLEILAKKFAFNCENLVEWCENLVKKNCCENSRISVHIEYSGCVVLPKRLQEWPGAAAGWVLLLKAPNLSEFYAKALFYEGFFLEFSRDYSMYNYDSARIPLGHAVDISLEATQYKRLPQKLWPKTSKEPRCFENAEQTNKCFETCYYNATVKLKN